MNMRRHFFLILILFPLFVDAQTGRPKIGLTLSGGGAKGLAHIGVLKAIDSAGLKIDMVTGTSMGSIMGALYAAGYSGKDIERIARGMDWSTIFSNRPPIDLINMNEKREYANYAIEIPIENGKAKFFSGFIEGEEIWLKFGELFYPVHTIRDFSKLPIPFACIATDAATGKAVVLKDGDLVKAVRASMAIPSVFTAVPYNNTVLIDGGVVHNFPVRDAKAMGADYIIGVNVSQGLLPADKLLTPVDMLYQIGFYKDADDFEKEVKLCNLLIEPDLKDFSAASFGSADSIIHVGNETGNRYYPFFKRFADSLRAIYPDAVPATNRLPRAEHVIIDNFEFEGLKHTTQMDFEGKLGLRTGETYSAGEITKAVRRAFSSGNFRRIAFFLIPKEPGHVTLRCEIVENPETHVKIGLHFHTYSNVALITALSTRNLILNRSKFFVKLNWSTNPRIILRLDQPFGRRQRWGAMATAYYEQFRYPIYRDFSQVYEYTSKYGFLDVRFYTLLGTTSMAGIGVSREQVRMSPKITPVVSFNGSLDYWSGFLFFQRSSLDTKAFPRKGSFVDFRASVIFNQKADFVFESGTGSLSSDSLNLSFNSYQQIKLKMGTYFPLGRRWSLIGQFNNGINLNYKDYYFNYFSVGGLNDFIRNQIPFAGISENQVLTGSISSLQGGVQYEPFTNLLFTLRANFGYYDYISRDPSEWSILSGYAMSGGYRTPLGPVEISLLYGDQSKTFLGYVNVGFTF